MELNLTKEINGEQFLEELKAAGVKLNAGIYPRVESGKLFIDVSQEDETKTQEIWNNHIAEDWAIKKNENRQIILDRLGLTQEEAKLLLS